MGLGDGLRRAFAPSPLGSLQSKVAKGFSEYNALLIEILGDDAPEFTVSAYDEKNPNAPLIVTMDKAPIVQLINFTQGKLPASKADLIDYDRKRESSPQYSIEALDAEGNSTGPYVEEQDAEGIMTWFEDMLPTYIDEELHAKISEYFAKQMVKQPEGKPKTTATQPA